MPLLLLLIRPSRLWPSRHPQYIRLDPLLSRNLEVEMMILKNHLSCQTPSWIRIYVLLVVKRSPFPSRTGVTSFVRPFSASKTSPRLLDMLGVDPNSYRSIDSPNVILSSYWAMIVLDRSGI
ncbi:hypothetical protein AGABI2DRAFT_192002 [Agaricus bisporus var. bisporus H97]|uniref:hypothetical protein n=1 Tax=Agaricus bisporus var. bisporus (strain H97 / ATCC MYA-4626 / FGSC 10389) TaxID=936046 RepID=UPI00029F6F89|nr:hypothetical protein AGABI2DRAFT_192002 [Agaricus bisporus var. bisporus H97]EKV48378.1 hypothetical protein AGABI2DRAFT_192002 [Agaricus bisporus var. bisporus H97]